MTVERRGMFDESLQYFANVISSSLRNEIQIIEIGQEDGQIVAQKYVCKYEFEPEQKITGIEWVQKSSSVNGRKGRGKKRTVSLDVDDNSILDKPVLAALLNDSEIWLFSPDLNQPTNKITAGFPISCMSKSYNSSNSLLVFDSNEHRLVEYSLETLEHTRVTVFKNKLSAQSIVGLPSDKKKALLVSDHVISLISLTNAKHPIITEFAAFENTITHVQPSYDQENKIVVSCEQSNQLYVIDVNKPKEIQNITATANIENFFIIKGSGNEEEVIFVVMGDLIEVYVIENDLLVTMKTSPPGSTVLVENIFKIGSALNLLTYDNNIPKFKRIEWDFKSTEDLTIQLSSDHTGLGNDSGSPNIIVSKQAKSEVLTSSQLFSMLNMLLSSTNIDTDQVLELCSSNNHENSVKETIQGFSSSEDPSLGDKLFAILSDEVSLDPSENNSYAIWLKWLLLSYGGAYSKSMEMYGKVKTLQQSLSSGMKLMPSLLALQGRLLLLKTQTSFRNQSNLEDKEEYSYHSEDIEETLTFANGENDESDIEDFDQIKTIEVGEEDVEEEEEEEES